MATPNLPRERDCRCPHCGYDPHVCREVLVQLALYDRAANCPGCGKSAPAEMWLRTVLLIRDKEA